MHQLTADALGRSRRENRTYVDETTQFYRDPQTFLTERFEKRGHYPSHMVLFEPLLPRVALFLARHGYRQEARFWHTLLVVDDRQGDALIYRRHPPRQ
jgi:phosphatidylinositol glycan class B